MSVKQDAFTNIIMLMFITFVFIILLVMFFEGAAETEKLEEDKEYSLCKNADWYGSHCAELFWKKHR